MFSNRKKNWAFVLISLILNHCSVKQIDFEAKNFSDEVQPLQNLIFKFNTKIVDEKVLNQWKSANYLKFEPNIPGKYKWTSSNELVFSPIVPLSPSTKYKVKLHQIPTPLTPEESKLPLSSKEIEFHTPYLRFADITPYWSKNQHQPELRLILHLNYEISPELLKDQLEIITENQKLPFSLLTQTQSSKIELTVQNVELKEDIQPLTVKLLKGITISGSNFSSHEDLIFQTEIPSKDFEITKTDNQHDGFMGTFMLYANQSFEEQSNWKQWIQIEPKIPFTVSIHQNQLAIQAEFLQDQSYNIKIIKGLTSSLGNILKEDYSTNAQFGEIGKYIKFVNENALYLNAKGNKKVGLHILNVDQFKVRVYKIFENNLAAFMRSNEYYYDYYFFQSENGALVYEKSFELKDLQKIGNIYALDLDFENILPSYHGIYFVEVYSEDEYYSSARKFVCITDIGLIAKANKNEMIVFANSLADAQPIQGLEVKLYSKNNQIIGTAKTGPGGLAILKNIDVNAKYFEPAMITASSKEDFSFLWLNTTRWDKVDFDVDGKRLKNEHYDAMIYAERPLYRPGETAHLNVIVRTPDWKNVSNMPVTFKIINPKNQTVFEELKNLDAQSAVQINYEIPRTAYTGNYTCQLYAGNTELIQSYTLTVEEFMPDRLKVNANIGNEYFKAGQEVKVNLQAFHLYGSPASGYNYEVLMAFKPQIFAPKGLDQYYFELKNTNASFGTLVNTGKTDNEGKATANIKIPEEWQNTGLWVANVSNAVFDENNRPVYNNLQKELFTQDIFFGIHRFDSYINSNAPLNVPIIAVDNKGKILQNIPAKVQVIHYTYETVIQRIYYLTSFQTLKKSKKVFEKVLTLNGENTLLNFTPTIGGEYEIRILTPGVEKSYVSYPFYAYGFWGNMTNFETDPKGRIIIESNKNSYNYNENAKILFKTPFEGKLIVTIERDKLLKHYTLQTKNQTASLDLNLMGDFVPNVFVCATLIRPYINNEIPLMVAHGAKKLIIENPQKKLNVHIIAQEKVKSRTHQTITVQTRPYAHVTLAAVDEGILQIKRAKTPNPYEYFYGPHALTVQQYDVYAKIIKEIGGFKKNSKAGGGADAMMFESVSDTRRMNPIMNNPANKFVSFWKHTQADANGIAKLTVNIPAFSGALRIMTQAYFNDQFGASEKSMIVADPVVLNIGTPLFASPGDTLIVPITLNNTTNTPISSQISLSSNRLLSLGNLSQNSFNLSPNQEQKAYAKIIVGNQLGIAKVQLKVKAGNETYEDETEIAIRPSSPLVFKGKGGFVEGGKSLQVQTDNFNFLQGTQQFQFVVSTNPVAQFSKNLNELIHYPHGCAEQTISTAFPQIYVQSITKGLLKKQKLRSNPAQNVQIAISKIEQLMDYTGGIHYWENSYISWWTTAYAAHFLKEAKNNGFEVKTQTLNQIANYLTNQTNQNIVIKNAQYYPRELAYSLYVLALMGKPNVSKMNYFKNQLEKFTPDSKIILGCAYGLAGDLETFQKITQTPFEYIKFNEYDLDFSSSLRERALILNTLLDVQPNNPLVSNYLTQIMNEVQDAKYLNTQELSFSLMALAKFANINKNQDVTASVNVNGTSYKVNSENPLILEINQLANFQIQAQGKGKIYYSYTASGVDKEGNIQEEDQFIKVRRTYFDKNGKPLQGKVAINELVKVQIEIQPLQNQRISNIVITDMIPSGFQIENERLNFNLMDSNDAVLYDYKDIRDDRVNYYVSLNGGKKVFTYYLRAVQRGTYVVSPIAADAMYDGNIHSYHGKGKISVE